MAGVMGTQAARKEKIVNVGRCLRGWVDGKMTFHFVDESPRPVELNRQPAEMWILQEWFTGNLLDE